ncbi:MAG: hypothetical protein NTV46_05590 [Verrucomicrobia bacterium]|nr:hypothetical protein [Verrucomicrobiota bacterium]
MKSPRNHPHRLATLGLSVLTTALCSPALHAAVTLNGTDTFVVSGTPTGDLTVTGDLSVVKGIDIGITSATPALAAVQLNYFGGPVNAAMFDLTAALGTLRWRDNLVATARDKMALDGANLLTLYKSDGTGVGILLNPNTGQLDLSGTGSGIYAGGTPVFNIGPTGNLLFGNRPINISATTPASSSTTGALTVTGGLGVAMDAYINGIRVGKGGGNVASNTAYGVNALQANTSGSLNTATGYEALGYNTTGYYNTAAGYHALRANTTGFSNTAAGIYALRANTTGGNNTAAGAYALFSNTTGSCNTATGYYALRINTTGGANTASGYQSLYYNTTGYANTAAGFYSLLSNTTGYYNTAAGSYALYANTTGGSNTAAGSFSLYTNTTGYYNTAAGSYALYANTTGGYNTAAGSFALYYNTTGGNNAAYSYGSLRSNTTGSSNTASGYQSLYYNTTGGSNVAIGSSAGKFQANGSTTLAVTNNSIYIGADTRGFSNLDQNSIVIGASAVGEGANTTVIGNSSTLKTHLYGTVNASAFTINNIPIMTPSYGSHSVLSNGAILALGNYANATQQDAIAIGTGAQASGGGSLALGSSSYCDPSAYNSLAMTGGRATNGYAIAAGYGEANGEFSMGIGTGVADGASSIALGGCDWQYGNWPGNHSTGENSVTLGGVGNQAMGFSSIAAGFWTTAPSAHAVALGSLNLALGSDPNEWVENDPLFELGNGYAPRNWTEPDASTRSNAITTLKNGQTTLTNKQWKAHASTPLADPAAGTASGGEALVVEGHTRLKGKVVIEQAQGDISMGIYGP